MKKQISAYKEIECLDFVSALACRLKARRYHSFRTQPAFRHFSKMIVSLCRLKEVDILDSLDTILQSITPFKVDGKYNLPTPENFKYLLIRFLSFAKILIRLIACAKGAFKEFEDVIRRAAFVETATIFMCCSSQIWSICVKLCKFACEAYNSLWSMFEELNGNIVAELPEKLDAWLGSDWNEHVIDSPKNFQLEAKSDLSLISLDDFTNENHDVMSTNEQSANETEAIPGLDEKYQPTLIVQQKTSTVVKCEIETTQNRSKNDQEEANKKKHFLTLNKKIMSTIKNASEPIGATIDLGQPIERKTDTNAKQLAVNASDEEIQNFQCIDEVKKFIDLEDRLRSINAHKATEHMITHQWRQFKQLVHQAMGTDSDRDAVRRFKGLWRKQITKRMKRLQKMH